MILAQTGLNPPAERSEWFRSKRGSTFDVHSDAKKANEIKNGKINFLTLWRWRLWRFKKIVSVMMPRSEWVIPHIGRIYEHYSHPDRPPTPSLHFSINLNIRREFFLVFLIFSHHISLPPILVHIRRDFFPHFAIHERKNAIYCDYADIELVKNVFAKKIAIIWSGDEKTGWGYERILRRISSGERVISATSNTLAEEQ